MTPDAYDSPPGQAPVFTRVYQAGGSHAHLRHEDGSQRILHEWDPDAETDPDTWLGTGDQDEYDRAAGLPLCPACFQQQQAAFPDPRLGAGHRATLLTADDKARKREHRHPVQRGEDGWS